jgi:SAM-dependent methyltransferase
MNLKAISEYYDEKIKLFGSTPNGVDWKDLASQYIRLQKITEILPVEEKFSINDLGCGYGELALYLREANYNFKYFGYDLSGKMITEAENRLSSIPNVTLIKNSNLETKCDFTVASGIFNVKIDIQIPTWQAHIYNTLNMIHENSARGFSFNILSSYSDMVKQRDHLYYGNPMDYLQYCLQNFSWNVRLDHSYDLYEFTISVLKGDK